MSIMVIDPVKLASQNVGGLVKLAKELGITHVALYSWRRVPAHHVLKIEKLSGISRHDLRPDVYGEAK
jgi:DNA-binding transcriptional regulator YdaS (Cro superfamily)